MGRIELIVMIKKLTNPVSLGWSLGTAVDYEMCHHMYGGSFITHPDMLAFIHSRFDCSPSVDIKRDSNGTLLCSIQAKLATALEFFQNNRSDSFGVKPPLYY